MRRDLAIFSFALLIGAVTTANFQVQASQQKLEYRSQDELTNEFRTKHGEPPWIHVEDGVNIVCMEPNEGRDCILVNDQPYPAGYVPSCSTDAECEKQCIENGGSDEDCEI